MDVDIDVLMELSHIDTYSIITELKMNSKLWCFDSGISGADSTVHKIQKLWEKNITFEIFASLTPF